MPESISKTFLAELAPVRDQLYSGALSQMEGENAPARTEEILRKAIQPVFQNYAAHPTDGISLELLAALREEIDSIAAIAASATATSSATLKNPTPSNPSTIPPSAPANEQQPEAMPAAVWARVAATVQQEAARLPRNSDTGYLSPDPLLTPKKRRPYHESKEGLNFSPTSRFALTAIIVLLLGISLTIYLTTRKHTHNIVTPSQLPTAPHTNSTP